MAYQVPYWHIEQWNDKPAQKMSRFSSKKSEVLKCSGSVHPDDSCTYMYIVQYVFEIVKCN